MAEHYRRWMIRFAVDMPDELSAALSTAKETVPVFPPEIRQLMRGNHRPLERIVIVRCQNVADLKVSNALMDVNWVDSLNQSCDLFFQTIFLIGRIVVAEDHFLKKEREGLLSAILRQLRPPATLGQCYQDIAPRVLAAAQLIYAVTNEDRGGQLPKGYWKCAASNYRILRRSYAARKRRSLHGHSGSRTGARVFRQHNCPLLSNTEVQLQSGHALV